MKLPIYITYATPDYTPYMVELVESLLSIGIPKERIVASNAYIDGDWFERVKYKPRYVQEVMQKHPETPVCWLDADAVIERKPILIEQCTADIAAAPRPHHNKYSGGILFFNATPIAAKIVKEWIVLTDKADNLAPDEYSITSLILKHRKRIAFQELPITYCWLNSESEREPFTDCEPVIRINDARKDIYRISKLEMKNKSKHNRNGEKNNE